MAVHHRRRGGLTPPPWTPRPHDQSDRGKKRNVPSGTSCRAVLGTHTFGSQTPPPPTPVVSYIRDSCPPPAQSCDPPSALTHKPPPSHAIQSRVPLRCPARTELRRPLFCGGVRMSCGGPPIPRTGGRGGRALRRCAGVGGGGKGALQSGCEGGYRQLGCGTRLRLCRAACGSSGKAAASWRPSQPGGVRAAGSDRLPLGGGSKGPEMPK